MARLIHKFNKNYVGLGDFEIRITLDLNSGYFRTDVPVKSLNSGNVKLQSKEQVLIDTIRLSNTSYTELIKEINEEEERYERFELDFERIIMLKIEERSSYMDGSGRGIIFNWGIFRKYKNPRNENSEFVLESSNPNERVMSYQYYKDWKEIKYSKEAVDFLIKIDNNLDTLIKNLVDLSEAPNIEEKILMLNK